MRQRSVAAQSVHFLWLSFVNPSQMTHLKEHQFRSLKSLFNAEHIFQYVLAASKQAFS